MECECYSCRMLGKAIKDKIRELDEKAFRHCFNQGKMCDECWERKKPLMELLEFSEKIGDKTGGKK